MTDKEQIEAINYELHTLMDKLVEKRRDGCCLIGSIILMKRLRDKCKIESLVIDGYLVSDGKRVTRHVWLTIPLIQLNIDIGILVHSKIHPDDNSQHEISNILDSKWYRTDNRTNEEKNTLRLLELDIKRHVKKGGRVNFKKWFRGYEDRESRLLIKYLIE